MPSARPALRRRVLKTPPDNIGRIGKTATTVAAIVGIFVTLNTLLSSCSRERIERAASYRKAVNDEERFWSDLYNKYLDTVASGEANSSERRARLMAIAMLSRHKIPDLEEFKPWYASLSAGWGSRGDQLPPPPPDETKQQLDRMRLELQTRLTDEVSSSPGIARDIAAWLDTEADSDLRARRDVKIPEGTTPPPRSAPPPVTKVAAAKTEQTLLTSPTPPSAAATVNYGTVTLSTGSPSGWDIDVFWCIGRDNLATYGRALAVATRLANGAQSGSPIAPGVAIGRVRLRALSTAGQASGRYYTKGDGIRADDLPGERDAAAKIAAFVRGETTLAVVPGGKQTHWYLSTFICNASPPK